MTTPGAAPYLRPLGVGEVLDAGIKVTRSRFKDLAILVAVVTVPVQVLSALVTISTTDEDTFDATGSTDTIGADFWTQQAGNLVVSLLGVVGTLIALAACTRIISGTYFGERVDWKESLSYAARRLPSLLWVGFLFGLMVGLGTLACLAPGVWLFVAYSVSVPALLLEGTRGWAALRRSFRLVRRRWWPVFGIFLLGYLLISIVQTVVTIPLIALLLSGVADNLVVFFAGSAILGSVATVVTTPFLVAMIVIIYLDLRVRKEGLDLQLMAERIGAPAPWPG